MKYQENQRETQEFSLRSKSPLTIKGKNLTLTLDFTYLETETKNIDECKNGPARQASLTDTNPDRQLNPDGDAISDFIRLCRKV